MLTLQNGLKDHMYRIGRHPIPLCLRCEEGHETPSYLFEKGITLAAIKCSIFCSTATTLDQVVHDRRLNEVLKFLSCAVLCCWLSLWWPLSYQKFSTHSSAHLTGTSCPLDTLPKADSLHPYGSQLCEIFLPPPIRVWAMGHRTWAKKNLEKNITYTVLMWISSLELYFYTFN